MALIIKRTVMNRDGLVDRGLFYEVIATPEVQEIELYVRVDKVEAEKTAGLARVSFCNKDTKQNEFGAVYNVALSLNGGNAIAQAYEYLKTLPEFSDAVDC